MKNDFIWELSKNPGDFITRSVFADWCEDNDEPELSECLRWMVKNNKRPYKAEGKNEFAWFNADSITGNLGDTESDIPGKLYTKIQGGKESANHKVFPSFEDAENGLYSAWKKIGGINDS
jgi:hypothetical protein